MLIVAVNCTEPGETCFCTSMGTGPEAGPGYDLALTELVSGERHAFLIEVGTEAGASVLAGVPHKPAEAATIDRARSAVAEAAQHMGRSMPAAGLRELMAGSHDADRWDDVASRFWLIRSGHVALDVHAPGGGQLIVETLGRGDLLGLSWFVRPYQWQFSATAVEDTMTFEFNADAVRAACESDTDLGYQLLQRVMSAASSRLQATRVRMLDLYGASGTVRGGP